MSSVAFVGLGAMGSRMAMNLHAAGHKLRVYNRDKAKAKPFADKGIEVCDSPAAAAKGAEFVCSIVSDDVATRQVMLGANGVVRGAAKGTIVLDSSTNTPAMAREAAFAAREKGIFSLGPVSSSRFSPLAAVDSRSSAGDRLGAKGDMVRVAATASRFWRRRRGGGREFGGRGGTRRPAPPLLFASGALVQADSTTSKAVYPAFTPVRCRRRSPSTSRARRR